MSDISKDNRVKFARNVSKNDNEGNKVIIARIEKKIWDWLGKYGRQLGNAACVIVGVWALYLMIGWINGLRTKQHLSAYATQTTLEERVAWAEESHPGALNNLRGFVFLEQANAFMQASNYEQAAVFYQKAKKLLKASPLAEQTIEGCAFAYMQLNQLDLAEKELLALYKCSFKYLKSQALYGLCYIADKKKDKQQFEYYKKQLATYEEGDLFLRKLDLLREHI